MSKLINELKMIIKKVRGSRRSSSHRGRTTDEEDEIEMPIGRSRSRHTRQYPLSSRQHQSYSYEESTAESMDQGLLRYLRQLTVKPRRHKHTQKHRRHRRKHRRHSSTSSTSDSSSSTSSNSSSTSSGSSDSSSSSSSSSCECCKSEIRQAETLRRISRYITARSDARGYSSRRAIGQSRGRSSNGSQYLASPSSRSRAGVYRRRIGGRSK
jgi:cobalamin biosynthesis Mg chelatase CobN